MLRHDLVTTYTSASFFIGGPVPPYKMALGWVLLAMIGCPPSPGSPWGAWQSSPSSPAGSMR